MTARYCFGLTLVLSLLAGCSTATGPESARTSEQRYRDAIIDAMVADEGERSFNLTAIRPDNSSLEWKVIDGESYVLVSN